MSYLSYERLASIIKECKPYRGTNSYPLTRRAHSYKRFEPITDKQGNVSYNIYYQYQWKERQVTKEDFDNRTKKNYGHRTTLPDGTIKHSLYERNWHKIGIVHKDNTLELTAETLHYGVRHFLRSMLYREVGVYTDIVSSVRHGGSIFHEFEGSWQNYKSTKMFPLFKGQRINLDTNTSVIDYQVKIPKVNRIKAKKAMSAYVDRLKFAEVMFKTMSFDSFMEGLQETFQDVFPKEDGHVWGSYDNTSKVLKQAKKLMKSDTVKAVFATMLGNRIGSAWHIAQKNGYYSPSDIEPYDYYKLAENRLDRQVKLANNTFDYKVYKANEPYPRSNWGVKVYLPTGKEVSLY